MLTNAAAIRVRPTLSVHGRKAVRDTVLPRGGGKAGRQPLFVPQDAYVLYSNYALYRCIDVFGSDVDEFRPERWAHEGAGDDLVEADNKEDKGAVGSYPNARLKPGRFSYLGFGAGQRSCPGEKLGKIPNAEARDADPPDTCLEENMQSALTDTTRFRVDNAGVRDCQAGAGIR